MRPQRSSQSGNKERLQEAGSSHIAELHKYPYHSQKEYRNACECHRKEGELRIPPGLFERPEQVCDGHPRNETDQKHCARQRSLVVEAPYINVQGEHQKPVNTEGTEEELRVFTLLHKSRRPKKIHNRHDGNHHSPNGPSINNEIIHNITFNGLTPQRYEESATPARNGVCNKCAIRY